MDAMKLICEVRMQGPPPGVPTGPTVFKVVDGEPFLVGGPGYVDGILHHFADALALATSNRERFGSWERVAFGGYWFEFRD